MNKDIRADLWDELKLLQSAIDKFDDISFRIKSWLLIVIIAIVGYTLEKPASASLLWINFVIVLLFYSYEVAYRISHGAILCRSQEVQSLLRNEKDLNDKPKGPYLDKYLREVDKVSDKGKFFKLQIKLGIEEIRAKRNAREWKIFFENWWKYLLQPRISLLYFVAIVVNMAFMIFNKFH